ncbi:hypothetical protein PR048_005215 [Dryococelus australis]|uniref:Uncharacterized protein n=1 Tax=Dryococelus australis TaxID=614101 RepID=A0ABQ9I7K8_9NEOP|nr:hypothetical protein PR048_005215 [Dryococelus australis]
MRQQIGSVKETLETRLSYIKEEVSNHKINFIDTFARQLNRLQDETDAGLQRTDESLHNLSSDVTETRKLVGIVSEEVMLQCTKLEIRVEQVERRSIEVNAHEQTKLINAVECKLQDE